MRMRNRFLLLISCILTLISCAPEPVRVTSITLNTKAITLEVGATERLSATVSPNNADNPTIIWTSDNASVAKVSDGVITAIAPGSARITAKSDDGGLSDVCVVTVPIPYVSVTGVSIDKASVSLYEGGTAQLIATITPSDADDPSLRWSSKNPDVVLVTTDGKLLGLAPGNADVTVETVDGNFSATCKVTVKEVRMELKPPTLDIIIGDEADIKVSLGEQLEGADVNVRWYSTEESIVSVNDKGHVKAHSVGDAVICAASEKGKTAFCKVHVRNKVESVKVTALTGESHISIGETLQLTANVTPANLPDIEIEWKSSDTSIATVNADGLVTAKREGTVKITATVTNGSQTKSSDYEIQVIQQQVKSIELDKTALSMIEGETYSLKATIKPENAFDKTIKWESSVPSVATVSDKGVVTAVKEGTAIITAKCGNKTASCQITVHTKFINVTGVSLDKESLTLDLNTEAQLTATVLPSNAGNKAVMWTSSDPSVVSVSAKDNVATVTAKSVGEAVIYVETMDGSFTKECKVTVNIPVSSITLSQTSATLAFGQSLTLSATVLPVDAYNTTLEWSSSNSSVASVSEGVVSAGTTTGAAIITVKSKSNPQIKATCKVTVKAEVILVSKITISPSSLNLSLNQTAKLTATVYPSNADNKTIIWSVPQGAITSVDQNGNVRAVKVGTSRIIAKSADGNAQAWITVTVTKKAVSSVSVSPSSLILKVGETYDLKATVAPSDASITTVSWSSSDSSVATVDRSSGRVTAKGDGEATITVQSTDDSTKKATCKVTVLASGSSSGGTEGVDFENWNF